MSKFGKTHHTYKTQNATAVLPLEMSSVTQLHEVEIMCKLKAIITRFNLGASCLNRHAWACSNALSSSKTQPIFFRLVAFLSSFCVALENVMIDLGL